MNIFEFAIRMEQDGERLYRQMAGQAHEKGMQQILLSLAEDELKHATVIRQLQDKAVPSEMAQTEILTSAQNVFEQMRGQEIDLTGTQIELYQQALEIERQSQALYQEQAQKVSEPNQKRLLLKIADEEARHAFLLDQVLIFISRPQSWIEDAEFNHLEEY